MMDKVYVRDLLKTIFTYKIRILFICALCVGFSYKLTEWMTKKYTARFEINVYSKYFQNPLISAVIPDTYNMPEMRFAIDSMVKEAMSDEYIDSIGHEYSIYTPGADEKELARQRQLLRENFSYYSTGGQSYAVSFTYTDPHATLEITQKTLKLVKDHIVNKRLKTIELVKEVMIEKLNAFNTTQNLYQEGAEKALASKSPDVLREELFKVNSNIEAMRKQYKESHPIMQNLLSRQKIISDWLSEYDTSALSGEVDLPITTNHNKIIAEQLSSKFYTKYHDFNIALDIERKSLDSYISVIARPQYPTSPVSPKKRIFMSLGFIFGLVAAFVYVYVCEVLVPSNDEKLMALAQDLDAPLLGTLPMIKKKKRVPVNADRPVDLVPGLEELKTLG